MARAMLPIVHLRKTILDIDKMAYESDQETNIKTIIVVDSHFLGVCEWVMRINYHKSLS